MTGFDSSSLQSMRARITSVGLLLKPDPADSFRYPDHIDPASLAALPSKPGIYIFRDAQERALYIGKSVNIRSRVLSHLRTPEEARLLLQTSDIVFRRTAGDIGAQLLESRLIKELQPLHNKKLRRSREMCSLRIAPDGVPEVVYAREHDFSTEQGLYGLFTTRRAALENLRMIVDQWQLCPVLCGLEAALCKRACFAHQIGRCRGACVGIETREMHQQRLQFALEQMRIVTWPYGGAMGIVEECDGWRQTHVVDHWFYLGSIDDANSGPPRQPVQDKRQRFDVDTYNILVKPLLQGALCVHPLRKGVRLWR